MHDFLSTSLRIKDEQISYYQENGHVRINQICNAQQANAFRLATNEAANARKEALQKTALEDRDTYGKAFLQIMNLWVDNPNLAKWILSRRFASVAAQLMGVEKVRIYHDQALYKEAGGGYTPMHQDQHYWPIDTNKCITMWMPLIDVTKAMGTLNFASGTSTVGYLGDLPISDDSEKQLAALCEARGFQMVNHGDMQAGDATFHSGWCLHGAAGNKSDTLREVMTIIWYEDNAKVIPKEDKRWNASKRNDLSMWLPGCSPGGEAASHINPLIEI